MNASSSHSQLLSDPQKLQITVGNCVQKAAELILHARISPLGERGAVNHWFGIECEELISMREGLHAWRQDMSQPLQLDLFVDTTGSSLMRDSVGASESEPALILLERWRFQYVHFSEHLGNLAWDRFYKRFMVLMRSIVSQLRLLPAHRFASSLSKLRGGALVNHTLSLPMSRASLSSPSLDFAVRPKQFCFPPPDMNHGQLDISVAYRPDNHFRREAAPQPRVTCNSPIGRSLIPDYLKPPLRERPVVAALCGGAVARESMPHAVTNGQQLSDQSQIAPSPYELEGLQFPPPPSEMPDEAGGFDTFPRQLKNYTPRHTPQPTHDMTPTRATVALSKSPPSSIPVPPSVASYVPGKQQELPEPSQEVRADCERSPIRQALSDRPLAPSASSSLGAFSAAPSALPLMPARASPTACGLATRLRASPLLHPEGGSAPRAITSFHGSSPCACIGSCSCSAQGSSGAGSLPHGSPQSDIQSEKLLSPSLGRGDLLAHRGPSPSSGSSGPPRQSGERYDSPPQGVCERTSGDRSERNSHEMEPILPPLTSFPSAGHELPFLMEEDLHPSEDHADAALGSLMMEVSAAPTLQLFSGTIRDGASSPLARSIEDMTQHLDRLSRTFHEAAASPPSMSPIGSPMSSPPIDPGVPPPSQPVQSLLPPAARLSSSPLLTIPDGQSLLQKPRPLSNACAPSDLQPSPPNLGSCQNPAAVAPAQTSVPGSFLANRSPAITPIQAFASIPQIGPASGMVTLSTHISNGPVIQKPSTSPTTAHLTIARPSASSSAAGSHADTTAPPARVPQLLSSSKPLKDPSQRAPVAKIGDLLAVTSSPRSDDEMAPNATDSTEKLLANSPPGDSLFPFATSTLQQVDR